MFRRRERLSNGQNDARGKHTGTGFLDDASLNAALDPLKLDANPKVHVLDLWNDMVNADGTIKKELFTPDNIHLNQDGGYALYAGKLKPVVEKLLAKP